MHGRTHAQDRQSRSRAKRAAGEGAADKGTAPTARELTEQAVQVLADGMGGKDMRIRLACAKEVIGNGKALAMTADLSQRLDGLDDDTLDAAIDAIRQALGAAAGRWKRSGRRGSAATGCATTGRTRSRPSSTPQARCSVSGCSWPATSSARPWRARPKPQCT